MKKIVKVLLISLMILMTFTVNAIADDDYQTVYEKYFGTSPTTDTGVINTIVVYVSVPEGVEASEVNLEDEAYAKTSTSPAWYAIGYYPTQEKLPWSGRYLPVITDANDIKILLGETPFKRDEIRTKPIYNTSFDLNRLTYTKLAFGEGAATKTGEEAFGTSTAVWHLDGVADKYIYSIKNGEELLKKTYVKYGTEISLPEPLENSEVKHFVKWECKDWNDAEYDGTTMPKKDITATAVFEDHKFDSYELTENGHREKCSTCSYLKDKTAHSYNDEGVCVCGDTSYVLTNLKNEVWTSGSDETVVFSSNANFDKFVEVRVDGTVVGSGNYDAYKGSTVVELKPSYLSTLSAGEHSIEVISNDGSCSGKFTVKVKPAPVVPTYVAPKTGID